MTTPSVAHAPIDAAPPKVAPLPTCPCGHDRHHFRVSCEGEHKSWAWIALMFGVSSKPVRVSWRCRLCDTTFDSSDDPALLHRRVF